MGAFPSIDGLTEPERRQRMLDAFAVPGYPGVYVLGCFATRVTFYSQQVRALNLVDCMCKSACIRERHEVAIIGAGAAGLTAAAALAVRGARARVFEMRASPASPEGRLPIQRASRQRVLHPHLYDWPWGDNATNALAGLPLLDWEVGEPREVMQKLERALLETRARTTGDDGTVDPMHPRVLELLDVAHSILDTLDALEWRDAPEYRGVVAEVSEVLAAAKRAPRS